MSGGEVIQDQDDRWWSISECSSVSFRNTGSMVSKALEILITWFSQCFHAIPCERELRGDGKWWHHPPRSQADRRTEVGPWISSTRTSLSRVFIRSYVSASSLQLNSWDRLVTGIVLLPYKHLAQHLCFIAFTTTVLEEVFQSFTQGNSCTKRYDSVYNMIHTSTHAYVEWGFVVL